MKSDVNILVVDDEVNNINALTRLLAFNDYSVIPCLSGLDVTTVIYSLHRRQTI